MKTTGLTLKEAYESGKPFRRKNEGPWVIPENVDPKSYWLHTSVIADDFELKVEREWTVYETPHGICGCNMEIFQDKPKIVVREVINDR